MQQGRYKFANHCVVIQSFYEEVHLLCRQYQVKDETEHRIIIKPEDVLYEKERSMSEDRNNGRKIREFSQGYYETLAVYRKLAEWLVEKDVLLFHGSAVGVDQKGYLFTAKSGTGKSTHTRFWRDVFGDQAVMINDDKPLLHITKDGVTVYGSPWDGKHHLSKNISMPLRGISIIKRNEKNKINIVTKSQAYPMLVQQSFHSNDPKKMKKILELIDELAEQVPLYELECNKKQEAAIVAFESMQGDFRPANKL